MAEREWQRMKETDSRECRNCHNFEYMDFSLQGRRAAQMHSTNLASGGQHLHRLPQGDCAPTA